MPIGDPLTNNVPAVGAAGTGYATSVNALLTEIKELLEAKVPFTSLQGSELDLDNVPIRDATYLELYEGAGVPASTPIGRLARYQNNLYWVTDEGVVRLTNGAVLDASSLGGITGDFGGANPATVEFVDAGQRYEFYDNGATNAWAYIRSLGVDIISGVDNTKTALLRYQGLVNSTFTLPPTLPASNRSVVTITSGGTLGHNDATSTITNDIVLGGATKIQHGDRTMLLAVPAAAYVTGTTVVAPGAMSGLIATTAGNGDARWTVNGLLVGQRIKSFKGWFSKPGATSTSLELQRVVPSTGAATSLGSASSTTSGETSISHTLAAAETVAADEQFIFVWNPGDNNEQIKCIELTFDTPA